LQRIEEYAGRIEKFTDKMAAGRKAALAKAMALPSQVPQAEQVIAARQWARAAARAQVASPEAAPTTEATQREWRASVARREEQEERIARWTEWGWEDRREWWEQSYWRTPVVPAEYAAPSGRREPTETGGWQWVPIIQDEDPDNWERQPWWHGQEWSDATWSRWRRNDPWATNRSEPDYYDTRRRW